MAKTQSANRAEQMTLDVAVVLSTTRISLSNLLNCAEGTLFEMDKRVGEPAEVEVNGIPFARGEVVAIGENFGVRILEVPGGESGQ